MRIGGVVFFVGIGSYDVCVFGVEQSIDVTVPLRLYKREPRVQLQRGVDRGGGVRVEDLVMLGGFAKFVWTDTRSDYPQLLQLTSHCAL